MLPMTSTSLLDMQNLLVIVHKEEEAKTSRSMAMARLLKISEEILQPTVKSAWSEAAAPLVERIKKLPREEFAACYYEALARTLPTAFNLSLSHCLKEGLKEVAKWQSSSIVDLVAGINFELNPDFFKEHPEVEEQIRTRADMVDFIERSEIVRKLRLPNGDLHADGGKEIQYHPDKTEHLPVKKVRFADYDLHSMPSELRAFINWFVVMKTSENLVKGGVLQTEHRASVLKEAHSIISMAVNYPAGCQEEIGDLFRELFSWKLNSSEILPFFQLTSQLPDQECRVSVIPLILAFIKETGLKRASDLDVAFISFFVEQIGSCTKETLNRVGNFLRDYEQAPRFAKNYPQVVQSYLIKQVQLSTPTFGLKVFKEFSKFLSAKERGEIINALADRLLELGEQCFKSNFSFLVATLEDPQLQLMFNKRLLEKYFDEPERYGYVKSKILDWLKKVLEKHPADSDTAFPGNYPMSALKELVMICHKMAPCQPSEPTDETLCALSELVEVCRNRTSSKEVIGFLCELSALPVSSVQRRKVEMLFVLLPYPLLCGVIQRLFSDYLSNKDEKIFSTGLFFLESTKLEMAHPKSFNQGVFDAMIDALTVLGMTEELGRKHSVFKILQDYSDLLKEQFTDGSPEVKAKILSKVGSLLLAWKGAAAEGGCSTLNSFTAAEKLEFITQLIDFAEPAISVLDSIRVFLSLIAVFERELIKENPKQTHLLHQHWKYLMPFARGFVSFIDFKGDIYEQLEPILKMVSENVIWGSDTSCRLFCKFIQTWMESLERFIEKASEPDSVHVAHLPALNQVLQTLAYCLSQQLSLFWSKHAMYSLKNRTYEVDHQVLEEQQFKILRLILNASEVCMSKESKQEFIYKFIFETNLYMMSPSTHKRFMDLLNERKLFADTPIELAAFGIYLGQRDAFDVLEENDQKKVGEALYNLLTFLEKRSEFTPMSIMQNFLMMLMSDVFPKCSEIAFQVIEMILDSRDPLEPLFEYGELGEIILNNPNLAVKLSSLSERILKHAQALIDTKTASYEAVHAELVKFDTLCKKKRTV